MPAVADTCTTIDEVLIALEEILQRCIRTNDRAGYFAVLYYCVTCRVKEGIQKNEFEDGARMEQLDVLFANRYLEAWRQWKTGQKPTASWDIAFKSATLAPTIVLQHLLLGINAHINLDLGIAAAETMQGRNIFFIEEDFNRINAILKAMVDIVQNNIGKVSLLFKLIDFYGKDKDELLVDFSIQVARDGAWTFAQELHAKIGEEYRECVATRDEAIAQLGSNIATPTSFILKFLLKIIRPFEWRSPGEIIQLLKIN